MRNSSKISIILFLENNPTNYMSIKSTSSHPIPQINKLMTNENEILELNVYNENTESVRNKKFDYLQSFFCKCHKCEHKDK